MSYMLNLLPPGDIGLTDAIQDLPEHLQEYIFEMTLELRKPKKICEIMLKDIHHHKGLFTQILKNTPVIESPDLVEKYSHLSFLLYKMVFVLNDYQFTGSGYVNNFVMHLFRNNTREEIVIMNAHESLAVVDGLSLNYLFLTLFNCWNIMSPQKRIQAFCLFK